VSNAVDSVLSYLTRSKQILESDARLRAELAFRLENRSTREQRSLPPTLVPEQVENVELSGSAVMSRLSPLIQAVLSHAQPRATSSSSLVNDRNRVFKSVSAKEASPSETLVEDSETSPDLTAPAKLIQTEADTSSTAPWGEARSSLGRFEDDLLFLWAFSSDLDDIQGTPKRWSAFSNTFAQILSVLRTPPPDDSPSVAKATSGFGLTAYLDNLRCLSLCPRLCRSIPDAVWNEILPATAVILALGLYAGRPSLFAPLVDVVYESVSLEADTALEQDTMTQQLSVAHGFAMGAFISCSIASRQQYSASARELWITAQMFPGPLKVVHTIEGASIVNFPPYDAENRRPVVFRDEYTHICGPLPVDVVEAQACELCFVPLDVHRKEMDRGRMSVHTRIAR
jgi:hypothetical protein